jgi:hypothetical protein
MDWGVWCRGGADLLEMDCLVAAVGWTLSAGLSRQRRQADGRVREAGVRSPPVGRGRLESGLRRPATG